MGKLIPENRKSVLAVLIITLSFLCSGFKYNIYPNDIPKGLPTLSKGYYRVIEHDAKKYCWTVYDAKQINVRNDDVVIPPPSIIHLNCGGGWTKEAVTDREVENSSFQELVTIIDPRKPIKLDYDKQIPNMKPAQAISKVKNSMSPKARNVWLLETHPYKDGILICGYNSVSPKAIATWWCKGNQVHNVNGAARTISKTLENTFDVIASETYEICEQKQ